jgi:hypothetical protein
VTSDSFGTITNFTTTGNTVLGDATTDTLTVGVTGIVKDATGKVGIGTASPNDVLEVAGNDAYIRVNRTGNEPGILLTYSNSATNRGNIAVTSGGAMYFTSGGNTERMRIDSSGNVGIGSSTITSADGAAGRIFKVSGSTNTVWVGETTGNGGYNAFIFEARNSNRSNPRFAQIQMQTVSTPTDGGLIIFSTSATGSSTDISERARIDSNGFLLVGGTSSVSSTAKIQSFSNAGNGGTGYIGMFASGSSLANQNVGFQIGQTDLRIYGAWDGSGNARNNVYVSAQSNGVQLSSGGTSWSAISDERQKDIIEPIENGLTKVASLRAVIGKYKTDAEGTRRSFLIAQDVKAVLPEAVGIEDAGQETEKLLLAYTDVIPLLVASIKELSAKNDALTARIEALENR